MTITAIALLVAVQTPSLVPDAPPASRPGYTPPGMVYDPVTGTNVPIKGWQPDPSPGMPAAGTKLRYNRIGQKIGEVPVRR